MHGCVAGSPRQHRWLAVRLGAALLALLAGGTRPAAAQAAGTAIEGRIRLLALTGDPPAVGEGARIELLGLGDGSVRATLTDHLGRFRWDDVPPGQYEVAATHPSGLGALCYATVPQADLYRLNLRLASRRDTIVVTFLWAAMALLITAACGAGMVLYGAGRGRRRTSTPRSLTVAFGFWIVAFAVLRALFPDMQPAWREAVVGLSAVIAALLSGCVVVVTVELRPTWPAAAAALLAGILLSVASRAADLPPDLAWVGIGVGLLLWTTAAGWLLSLWLRRQSYLVLAAITIAIMDCYSVFHGFTGAAVTSQEPALQALVAIGTLPWPILGSDLVSGVIGMGDFLFLAWFLAAALRFEFGVARNYWALMGAFTVGITVTQTLAIAGVLDRGLPALPFMSLMFLLANRSLFDLGRDDKRRIAGFVSVLLVVVWALIIQSKLREPAGREDVAVAEATAVAPAAVTPSWPLDLLRGAPGELALAPARPGAVAGQAVTWDGAPWGWLAVPGRPERTVLVLLEGPAEACRGAAERWRDAGWRALVVAAPAPDDASTTVAARQAALDLAGRRAAGAVAWLTATVGRPPEAVVGEGCGGAVALSLAVAEPRIGAVAVVGCGATSGDPGQVGQGLAAASQPARDRWLRTVAPERYAVAVRQPTAVVAATNAREVTLAGVSRLYELAAATRKTLLVQPNATYCPRATTTAALARWLAVFTDPLGQAPGEPEVTVGAADGAAGLRLAVRAGALSTHHVSAWVSLGDGPWPGRWWQEVPLRRGEGEWTATVALAGSASAVAVLARVETTAGLDRWSRLRRYALADLGLAPSPPAWPSPFVSTFDRHLDGWRLAAAAEPPLATLRWVAPGLAAVAGRAGPVTIETNRVAPLRQLGGQATELVCRLAGQRPPGEWSAELVERSGDAAMRVFRAPPRAAILGADTVTFPLRAFRGAQPVERPVWAVVDALVLHLPPGSVRLDEVRLVGPAGGEDRLQ